MSIRNLGTTPAFNSEPRGDVSLACRALSSDVIRDFTGGVMTPGNGFAKSVKEPVRRAIILAQRSCPEE